MHLGTVKLRKYALSDYRGEIKTVKIRNKKEICILIKSDLEKLARIIRKNCEHKWEHVKIARSLKAHLFIYLYFSIFRNSTVQASSMHKYLRCFNLAL